MTGGFACTILACAFSVLLFDGALATPIHRENIPLNAEVFAQPEYVEALAKELEKEVPSNVPVGWLRYQQRLSSEPNYRRDTRPHGNLDPIGGGNLLRRNLDSIGGGHLVKRRCCLDPIGGGGILQSLQPQRSNQAYAEYQE